MVQHFGLNTIRIIWYSGRMKIVFVTVLAALGGVAIISFFTGTPVKALGKFDCPRDKIECFVYQEGNKQIQVNLRPKNPIATLPFDIEVVGKGMQLKGGEVKLVGVSHTMDPVLVALKPNQGVLEGRGSFGICSEKYMIWQGYLIIDASDIRYLAQIEFKVKNE